MAQDASAQHTDAGSTPDRLAGADRRAWSVLLGVTLMSLVIDLWTKHLAFARLAGFPLVVRREDVLATRGSLHTLIPPHEPTTVIPSVLDLTLVLNPGAVFGMGAGKRWFFVLMTLIAVVGGLVVFSRFIRARERWSQVAIGLILGGGLGNLYDRLIFACVRDFLHPLPGVMVPFGWSWPWGGREVWPYVSNIADAFLLVGVGILSIKLLRAPAPPVTRPAVRS